MAGKKFVALGCVFGCLVACWIVMAQTENSSPGKANDATAKRASQDKVSVGDIKNSKPDKPKVTITEEENDTTVALSKGDILAVRLKAQLGTGYSWSVGSIDSDKLKQDGKVKTEKKDETKLGGEEFQVFRFKAIGKGSSRLELEYKQPFDKEAKPEKTFKVDVEIK